MPVAATGAVVALGGLLGMSCRRVDVPQYKVLARIAYTDRGTGDALKEVPLSEGGKVVFTLTGLLPAFPTDSSVVYREEVMLRVWGSGVAEDDFRMKADGVTLRGPKGEEFQFRPLDTEKPVSSAFSFRKDFALTDPDQLVFGDSEYWYELHVRFDYGNRAFQEHLGRVRFAQELGTITPIQ